VHSQTPGGHVPQCPIPGNAQAAAKTTTDLLIVIVIILARFGCWWASCQLSWVTAARSLATPLQTAETAFSFQVASALCHSNQYISRCTPFPVTRQALIQRQRRNNWAESCYIRRASLLIIANKMIFTAQTRWHDSSTEWTNCLFLKIFVTNKQPRQTEVSWNLI